MFTSTLPRLLFLPIIIRLCRTKYSNSRPSSLAMGVTVLTPDHSCLAGLTAPDFRASKAKASLSWSWLGEDIFHWQPDSKFPCVAQEKGSKAKQQHEEKHTGIPQTLKFQIWRSLPNMEAECFSHRRIPYLRRFSKGLVIVKVVSTCSEFYVMCWAASLVYKK